MIVSYKEFPSQCHKLDLGQNSLLGTQQYTTVEAAAAIKAHD